VRTPGPGLQGALITPILQIQLSLVKIEGKSIMKKTEIRIEQPPQISGLTFRKFLGEPDFPAMMVIIEAAAQADNQETGETLEDLKHDYEHLTDCDPYQDMIFAEIEGKPIAYSRVEWYQEEEPNDRIYGHFVNILPEWRGKGIEDCHDQMV
jgi:hypothetical protein